MRVQVAHDRAGDRERVLVAGRVVVGDARSPRVHVGAAELLGRDVLAGRRLHERRSADEDRAGAADDHGLVAHRRHVGAACRARAHHDRDLRDPGGGHPRLVEEDPAEVVPVGEDLRLEREERAARVDQVEARQAVLLGDLLRAQVLLHRQREVRPALHGRVVGDDHALAALDDSDPRDDPGGRRLAVVQLPCRQRRELEERRVRVDEQVDPLAGGQLAARSVALDGGFPAAARDPGRALAELLDERAHSLHPAREEVAVSLDLGGEEHRRGAYRHPAGPLSRPAPAADREVPVRLCWERQKAVPHRLAYARTPASRCVLAAVAQPRLTLWAGAAPPE